MRAPPRQLVLASVLAVIAAVGLASGLARRSWVVVAGWLEPWQRDLAGGRDPEPGKARYEQLIEQVARLTTENVTLRRRLDEYRSIEGEGHVGTAQAVVARGSVVARTTRQGRRFCELDIGAVDGVDLEIMAIRVSD